MLCPYIVRLQKSMAVKKNRDLIMIIVNGYSNILIKEPGIKGLEQRAKSQESRQKVPNLPIGNIVSI